MSASYLLVWNLHCDSGCHTLLVFQRSSFIYQFYSCIMSVVLNLFLNEAMCVGLLDATRYKSAMVTKGYHATLGASSL